MNCLLDAVPLLKLQKRLGQDFSLPNSIRPERFKMFGKEVFVLLQGMEAYNIICVMPLKYNAKKRNVRWNRSRRFFYQFWFNRLYGFLSEAILCVCLFLGMRAWTAGRYISVPFVLFLFLMVLFNPILILMDNAHWNRRHDLVCLLNSFIRMTAVIDRHSSSYGKTEEQQQDDEKVELILLNTFHMARRALVVGPFIGAALWIFYFESICVLVIELVSLLSFLFPLWSDPFLLALMIIWYMYYAVVTVHRAVMFAVITGSSILYVFRTT